MIKDIALFWLNTQKSIKNPESASVEVFLISFFDVKQTCKIVPSENCNVWSFWTVCM